MPHAVAAGWLPSPHVQVLLSLLGAFALGGLIGWERQVRQRTAGLRTIVLVALAASMFVSMSMALAGGAGAVRVIAYVASGIGFLGAGVILRDQGTVRGINTAATLWGAAAVGAACGCGEFFEALFGTALVLCANTALRPVVSALHRPLADLRAADAAVGAPAVEADPAALFTLWAVVGVEHSQALLAWLQELAAGAGFAVPVVQQRLLGSDVEIAATLDARPGRTQALDRLVRELGSHPGVHKTAWVAAGAE